MDDHDNKKYLEALLIIAKSRTAVIYCIRNLNRVPEVNSPVVFGELTRLAQISGDTLNEVMSKVLMALLTRSENAEILATKGVEVRR